MGPQIKKMMEDPFYQLENKLNDEIKAQEAMPQLEELAEVQDDRWKNDFELNLQMRKKFKVEKKVIEAEEKKKNEPKNFGLEICQISKAEEAQIRSQKLKSLNKWQLNQVKHREQIKAQSIFQTQQPTASKAKLLEHLQFKVSMLPRSTQKKIKLELKVRIFSFPPCTIALPYFRDESASALHYEQNTLIGLAGLLFFHQMYTLTHARPHRDFT